MGASRASPRSKGGRKSSTIASVDCLSIVTNNR